MSKIVELDIEKFRESHIGLSDEAIYTDELLESLWENCEFYVGGNDENSPIPYDDEATPKILERSVLMDLILCHLATLSQQNGTQTGRLTSATEGSVSVGYTPLEIAGKSMSAQFWGLTQCGMQYWMLTQKYRLGGRLYRKAGSHYHPWG